MTTEKKAKRVVNQECCPHCGAERSSLCYEDVEIDGKEATQAVSCMECERGWTEVYTFSAVIIDGERFEIN